MNDQRYKLLVTVYDPDPFMNDQRYKLLVTLYDPDLFMNYQRYKLLVTVYDPVLFVNSYSRDEACKYCWGLRQSFNVATTRQCLSFAVPR